MNIFVTGASGFIAAQIVTDLIDNGHQVVCAVRDISLATRLFPKATIIACDFENDTKYETWKNRLKGCDIVINCVGILYHPNNEIIWNVHYHTPKALFDACVVTGVKRIIQISALGVERAQVDYAKSKKAADDYLLTLPIPSIVLRPSVVYARGSYGGTSLFRGLAGFPLFIPIPGNGKQEMQPIHLHDLSKAILTLLTKPLTHSIILNAVGPKKEKFLNLLSTLRSWLGFKKVKTIDIPNWCIKSLSLLGNLIPYSTINTTSYSMLMQNNITSEEESKRFFDFIGFMPRNLQEGIYQEPSSVQDRWHARLYFLKPALRISIAFIWIFTAITSAFLFPKAAIYELMTKVGISAFWQSPLLYGTCLIDAILGIAMLGNYKLRQVYLAQFFLIVAYTLTLAFMLPILILDPFGPLIKNIPILLSILVLLAIESDK